MDEIIYLESDEEITSVIDKLKQAKSNRVSLVVPREATLLQSVVNLKLLVKEGSSLGKELAIITADKIGRNLAAKVGLQVYDSVKNPQPVYQPPSPEPSSEEVIEINDAPQEPITDSRPKGVNVHHFQESRGTVWKKPQEEPQSQAAAKWHQPKIKHQVDWGKSRRILWPLLAIVFLLILIGAFLILPKADVKLQVKSENFEKNQDIEIDSNIAADNIADKVFAGELINLTQEKEESFPATGKKNLGGKASGTLTIYNNLDSNAHSLPAGTKLSSSSKTFILKNSVSVPGAAVQSGRIVPGSIGAEIEAEEPGEEYNVKAGRFTIIGLPAEQQEAMYGQSSNDLTGGFSKEVQVVSQEDYDKAKEKILNELNDGLSKELEEKALGKDVLENVTVNETLEESSSAKVDGEAADFTLKIRQGLKAIVFSKNEFDQFVLDVLEQQQPSDKMLSLGSNDSVAIEVKEKDYDKNILKLATITQAKISTRIDTEKVRENLFGKNQKEVQSYLNNLEGLTGSQINYWPKWWPIKRISNIGRFLTVSLDYLGDEPVPTTSPTPQPEISPTVFGEGVE